MSDIWGDRERLLHFRAQLGTGMLSGRSRIGKTAGSRDLPVSVANFGREGERCGGSAPQGRQGARGLGPAVKLAVLEERMKTMQAEYKTDIAMLAADNAKRDAEHAKRDKQQLLAIAGIVGLATAILGVLIGVLALS